MSRQGATLTRPGDGLRRWIAAMNQTDRNYLRFLHARLALYQGRARWGIDQMTKMMQARQPLASDYETNVLETLVPALSQQGRYREALNYQLRLSALRDSMVQENTLRQAQELQTIYETERREQQLRQQRQHIADLRVRAAQRETQLQRRMALLGVVVLLAMSGIGYWLRQRQRQRQQREAALRTQIAADLHDEVGTLLTRVNMQAELLRETQPEADTPALDRLLTNSRTAASTMRDIVWGIDAQSDTVGDLLDRMRDHLDQSAIPAGWLTELRAEGLTEEAPLRAEVRQQLYLIFKEAVTNALRHARQATRLQVELRQEARQLYLLVQDDGVPTTAPGGRSGLGLRSMHRRAEAVGGRLIAEPTPQGFRVEVWLPF